MNAELVSALTDNAQVLMASPTQKATKLQVSRSDMFANIGGSGNDPESEEVSEFGSATSPAIVKAPQSAAVNLKPLCRIVGFP